MALSTEIHNLRQGPANPDGKTFGTSATDPIAFYGATPVNQTSGGAQAALSRGVACGTIATFATSQSPVGVANATTLENGITCYNVVGTGTGMTWQIATGDVLIVNKPTAQAGLGVGNVRVSGTNVAGVTFSNWTTATITPTAGQKYGIVAIRGLTTLTAVLTPAVVAAATTAEQTFAVPGLRVGEVVIVSKPTSQATLDIVGARVASANTLGITFGNTSATTAATPTAGETYTIWSTGGIDMVSNTILVEQNVLTPAAATATAMSAQSYTMTGLATTDAVIGISKPTFQATAVPVTAFVSAANAIGIAYANPVGAATTPTANEVYSVVLHRPNPAAPCIVYSSVQTPSVVAGNTTTEQTWTVTGVIASSVVVVNKPTPQAGLGLVGARVSGTNQIAVTFCNATAASITPTAGESYLIANFQQAIPDNGSAWVYTVAQQQYQGVLLANAVQAALAGNGMIAGA